MIARKQHREQSVFLEDYSGKNTWKMSTGTYEEIRTEILDELFSIGRTKTCPRRTEVVVPLLNETGTRFAANTIKNKRTPRPDGIPSEIVKMAVDL